jgi:hypothetical protein
VAALGMKDLFKLYQSGPRYIIPYDIRQNIYKCIAAEQSVNISNWHRVDYMEVPGKRVNVNKLSTRDMQLLLMRIFDLAKHWFEEDEDE